MHVYVQIHIHMLLCVKALLWACYFILIIVAGLTGYRHAVHTQPEVFVFWFFYKKKGF